jgi:hypothetical protein
MKRIFFLLPFLTAFFLLALYSCETEPLDPVLAQEIGNNQGNNPGNGNNSGPVLPGDYWPRAVNNTWNYNDNGVSSEVNMQNFETISGQSWIKFSDFFGSSMLGADVQLTAWLRRNVNEYIIRQSVIIPADDEIGFPQITFSPVNVIVLKQQLNEGDTWVQTATQTLTIAGGTSSSETVTFNGKILSKDQTFSVGGVNYENVIHVRLDQISSLGSTSTQYWFARDIGLVKQLSTSEGQVITSWELISYTLN